MKQLLKRWAIELAIGLPICVLSYRWFLYAIEPSWLRILYYFFVRWAAEHGVKVFW